MRDSGLLGSFFNDSAEERYWSLVWHRLVAQNKPDSWAYRWAVTCFVNGGLTILPNRNLVNNTGFSDDTTHTANFKVRTSFDEGLPPIKHPTFVLRDAIAVRFTFDNVYGGKSYRFPISLVRIFKSLISSIVHDAVSFVR